MVRPAQVHDFLEKYYTRLCQDAGGVPSRPAVSPAEMKPILPWILVVDREGPRHIVPRIVGSAVEEALQARLTGLNFFDIWPEELASKMDVFYSHLTNQPCGGDLVRTVKSPSGILKGYRTTLFPLLDGQRNITKLLGVVSAKTVADPVQQYAEPKDLVTLDLNDVSYIDIGFGVPQE